VRYIDAGKGDAGKGDAGKGKRAESKPPEKPVGLEPATESKKALRKSPPPRL
jgi:hypothetical protein